METPRHTLPIRNTYWPAMYLIDKRGIIRYIRIGEGGYNETERMIQRLLDPTYAFTLSRDGWPAPHNQEG